MKKYAYYPGCTLGTTGVEYGLSAMAVCEKLGIEMWEIPDYNCCGSSSAHLVNPYLALGLAARNMAIAEEAGLDVAIPCAACYSHSKAAQIAAKEDEKKRAAIEEMLGREYKGESRALSILEVVDECLNYDELQAQIVHPLKGLKVVTYYGCLLSRPQELACDDAEDPVMMDKILTALGAEVLPWSAKTECCGASHTASEPSIGVKMTDKILLAAQKSGADCIATACPMCMGNLDMRQEEAKKKYNHDYNLPIYYFTELLGLALGIAPKTMGSDRHFVPAMEILEKYEKGGGAE